MNLFNRRSGAAIALLLLASPLVSQAERAATTDNSPPAKSAHGSTEEAGSKLWTQNCGRCHNRISPEEYSDAQWEVIGDHMRLRANLPPEDVRQIIDFLKTAN